MAKCIFCGACTIPTNVHGGERVKVALEDFFEDARFMRYELVPDGLGDTMGEYVEGDLFRAGISMVSSTQAEIAYRNGTKTIYHIVTTKPGMHLKTGDVIRRIRDGRLYKVTTVANETPDMADVQHRTVTAEVIE